MITQTFSLFSLILGVFLTSFKHFYKKTWKNIHKTYILIMLL